MFIITKGGTQFSDDVGLAIVTDVTKSKDADGQDIINVTYVQDEEEGTVTFNDDSEVAAGKYDYDDLDVGSVFAFNANAEGVVSDYVVIGVIKSGVLDVDQATFGEFSDDNVFMMGYIANSKKANTSKGETIEIKDNAGINETISVSKADSNKYTYNDANSRNVVIETEDFMAEDAYYYDDNDTTDVKDDEATIVFVRLVNGSVVDIYSFNKRVTPSTVKGFNVDVEKIGATTPTTPTTPVAPSAVVEEVEEVVEAPVEEVVIPEEIEANVIED